MNKQKIVSLLGSPIAYYVEFAKMTGSVEAKQA